MDVCLTTAIIDFLIEHSCAAPGCGSVLVLDGNCKNYRDVCKACDAGYVEYEGLEGVVKTGCMNSPKSGSRFCELHIENIAIPQQLDPEEEITSSMTNDVEDSVIATVVGKRSIRNATYYQVNQNPKSDSTRTGVYSAYLYL